MTLPLLQTAPGPRVVIDGRHYLYFAGTGYLGLQSHHEVLAAAADAAQRYGIHSATTRAGFGTQPPTLEVEARAAELMQAAAAFYFITGYASMTVLLTAVEDRFDAVFVDSHGHYSVKQALRLIRLPVYPFNHRNPADLAVQLRSHLRPGGRPLVISDGVFAVTGRIAPLDEYQRILRDYPGSGLAVDDAHGLGVLGENGRGTLEHFGLDSPVNLTAEEAASHHAPALLHGGTLSKAAGGQGGFVAGSAAFIEHAKRSGYFTAATPPAAPVAAATAKGLQILQSRPELRRQLHTNTAQARAGLRKLGLPVDDSPVPILGLHLGDPDTMQRIQHAMMERGIAIAYIRGYSDTTSEGALRIAIFATHTAEMIQQMLDTFAAVL